MTEKRITTDAVKIMEERYFKNYPNYKEELEAGIENSRIAEEIYALRTKAGLTQEQLAKLINTSHTTISRLEDSDYEGHSMAMLRRIATALDKRVVVKFLPIKAKHKAGRQLEGHNR
jgi:DNA-binding XRE family transcriptional regulator